MRAGRALADTPRSAARKPPEALSPSFSSFSLTNFLFSALPQLLHLLRRQESHLKEEVDRGVVHGVAASQRRHSEERSTSGSHVTDRGCSHLQVRVQQDSWPRPPGVEALCARRPTCISCSTPALGASTRCALWPRAVASSMATIVRT